MYEQIITKVSNSAKNKEKLYNSKGRYLVASILAGVYVGFGILLIFTISGYLGDSPANKIVMGVSFGVALSLVIMAGSELFTGNNFVMTMGSLNKDVKYTKTLETWIVCYIGNILGAMIVSIFFVLALLGGDTSAGEALSSAALSKATAAPMALFFRGILCNILVCLAVLCSIKLENEVAKLIMIWWCLFVFITAGFEHSVANMTVFSASIFAHTGITFGQMGYNLFFVTLGNIVGGVLLALAYFYIGNTKEN